ncbi:MAG: hypothetical protein MR601_00530 [Erysipelotrichaceae bacterium]|nr:hypothetical protein [Erysipelotrichaceae bacterium]
MIQLKKIAIYCLLCIMFITISANKNIVNANEIEIEKNEISVIVPINHADMPNLIKTQILNEIVKIDKTIILENVDFDKTSFFIEDHLDGTKVSNVKKKVLLNIVNKQDVQTLTTNSMSLDVNFEFIDTTIPELVLTQDKVDVALNDVFDPWVYVKYAYDNSKVYPTVAIINNVDVSTVGKYEVIFAASDESGNRYQTVLEVNVTKDAQRVSNVVYSGDDIQYMLDLINAERSNIGLEPLALADENGQLAVAIRANEAAGYLSHYRPDGSHYKTALIDQNVSFSNSPLEVLTYAGSSVESKFNWWMSSKNHRAILMSDGNYKTVAIGYSGSMWCAIVY